MTDTEQDISADRSQQPRRGFLAGVTALVLLDAGVDLSEWWPFGDDGSTTSVGNIYIEDDESVDPTEDDGDIVIYV